MTYEEFAMLNPQQHAPPFPPPPKMERRTWKQDSRIELEREVEKNTLRPDDYPKIGVGCLQRIADALETISGHLHGIERQLFRNTPRGKEAARKQEQEEAELLIWREKRKAFNKAFKACWQKKCRTIKGTAPQKATLKSKVEYSWKDEANLADLATIMDALDIVALFKPGTKGRAYAESIKGEWEAKP